MRAVLDNRLRLKLVELNDDQIRALQSAFTYENPQWKKLKGMGRRWVPKSVPRYLHTWALGDGWFSVPRGGLDKVEKVVGTLVLEDQTTLGDPSLAGEIPAHVLKLRPYQARLRDECTDRIGRAGVALIRSPAGSGKTTTCYAIAAKLNLPTLVITPTAKIFDQWIAGVEKNLGMDPNDVGIIQGARRFVAPLTIGMQQTLRNCAADYVGLFGVLILDESQLAPAESFVDVVDLFPTAYRIGVSADERRADRKECITYDVFGPVSSEVDRQGLVDAGSIVEAEVRIVPTDFRAHWYTQLKPRQRAKQEVQHRLANEIAEDEARNELVMELLGWCVDEGKATITLARRREHCATLNAMSLARGWNSGLMLGGAGGDKAEFERTLGEMRDGDLRQAVGTYQAVGVGFDLPVVSRGIFASPCASQDGRMQFAQFCGRFERPCEGKSDSVVYYLWDRHVHGIEAVRRIARWKRHVYVKDGDFWAEAKSYIKEQSRRESEKEDQIDFFGDPA